MINSTGKKANKTKHNMVLTSCLYPPDLLRQRIAFRMMNKITAAVDEKGDDSTINTLLFAGDIIYADASAGILDPSDPEEKFGGAYQRLRETQSWQKLDNKMDYLFHTIDDHEIVDNWEHSIDQKFCKIDGCDKELMKTGKRHFYNFTQADPDNLATDDDDPDLWGRRHLYGLHLFLLDTRTERQARSAKNSNTANMIGKEQEADLLNWLDELHALDLKNTDAPPVPKFIMSGSMILPRRANAAYAAEQGDPTLQSDSWDGYPRSRENLLSHIAENNIKNVVLLSGDEHLPIEATINLTSGKITTTVYSLHGSPMWAPFEFANTHPSALMETDSYIFSTSSGREIVADVTAEFPGVGNGFLHIEMDISSPTKLSLEYVGDRDSKRKELPLCTRS